jgi:glutathione S-transferase
MMHRQMSGRTLYFLPGSAAMAPQAALEEAGLEYDLVRVERRDGVVVQPANYLELNPAGRVPTLVDGDAVVTESAAIVLHVADRAPASGLLPPPQTAARSECYRWLVYLTNTVQASFISFFDPARFLDGAPEAEVKAAAERTLQRLFEGLDARLAGRQHLAGDTFSAVDLYLFMLTRWGRNLAVPSWSLPNVGAHYRRLAERPAVARMHERQGIAPFPDA